MSRTSLRGERREECFRKREVAHGGREDVHDSQRESGPDQAGFLLEPGCCGDPDATSELLEMACHVTNITNLPAGGRLGVSWHQNAGKSLRHQEVSSELDSHWLVDAVGNLKAGPSYSDRLDKGTITLTRVQPNTFKLRFCAAQKADMGQYTCRVSASTLNSQGGYVDATEQLSPALPIKWEQKILNVAAKTVREATVGGSTFEMSCVPDHGRTCRGRVTLSSSSIEKSLSSSPKTLVSLSPDSVVQHGDLLTPKRRRERLPQTHGKERETDPKRCAGKEEERLTPTQVKERETGTAKQKKAGRERLTPKRGGKERETDPKRSKKEKRDITPQTQEKRERLRDQTQVKRERLRPQTK
ncbi:hypothetical protein WMY93_022339 [Mugilogobius chulae]|uniref:Ig-like domain-containing protein n=1 Tax=Mugilogobius chulae TaxID=88201 RepID=A0AAW0NGX0_9GOBI